MLLILLKQSSRICDGRTQEGDSVDVSVVMIRLNFTKLCRFTVGLFTGFCRFTDCRFSTRSLISVCVCVWSLPAGRVPAEESSIRWPEEAEEEEEEAWIGRRGAEQE